MLGPSHALSGAAAWLAGTYIASEFAHIHQSPATIAIGTAMCAGGALVPDLDMSGRVTTDQGGATVAHTFGVVSLFLAECIEKLSLGVYDLSKTHKDPRRRNGHRTFTHTLIFNAALGFGVFEACTHYGRYAILTTLFLMIAFAMRGLFPSWEKRAGMIIATGVAIIATYWAEHHLPVHHSYPLLGVSVGVGGIVHLLGDMLTSHGCPTFWPLPMRGQTWHCVGLPKDFSVKVGGKVEVFVMRPLFFVVSLAAAIGLSEGWFATQVDRFRS